MPRRPEPTVSRSRRAVPPRHAQLGTRPQSPAKAHSGPLTGAFVTMRRYPRAVQDYPGAWSADTGDVSTRWCTATVTATPRTARDHRWRLAGGPMVEGAGT